MADEHSPILTPDTLRAYSEASLSNAEELLTEAPILLEQGRGSWISQRSQLSMIVSMPEQASSSALAMNPTGKCSGVQCTRSFPEELT